MGVQVTELTLNKSCHEKEFIDFEFDGKHISEFGMVAVADGGRHSFDAAPTFENETSSVNGVDGQYYWGTHFGSKKMTFSLATDGMTEAQVNAFKLHFKPGKYGEFIEDKLSCRKAYARVAQVVTFNMVPFRVKKEIQGHAIYINEYKGDCRITFEFDNPYFETTSHYVDLDEEENLEKSLRAIYINGTPHTNSWKQTSRCVIGGDEYFNGNAGLESMENGLTLSSDKSLIYYNPATAKTKGKLTLEITPSFTSNFPIYFNNIYDDVNEKSTPYNRILYTDNIEISEIDNVSNSHYTHEFRYTSPDVVYQINKAIQMAHQFTDSTALDFEEQLRLEIVNSKVMGWAASVLRIIKTKDPEYYDNVTGNFKNGVIDVDCSYVGMAGTRALNWKEYFNIFMLYMLAECPQPNNFHIDQTRGEWKFNPILICFDSEQNRAYMKYSYNQIISILEKYQVEEESCGDMILSEYLNLDGGDTLLENDGTIASVHKMKFIQGENNIHSLTKVYLYYTPTYF